MKFIFFSCLCFLINFVYAQDTSSRNIVIETNQIGELNFPYVKYNSYFLKEYKKNEKSFFKGKVDTTDRYLFLPITEDKYKNSVFHTILPILLRSSGSNVEIAFDKNRNLNFDDDDYTISIKKFNNKIITYKDENKNFSFFIKLDTPAKNANINKLLPKQKIIGFDEDGISYNVRFNNVLYGFFDKKYIIGVYDANFNGKYNESEKDRYFVANAKTGYLSYEETFPVNQGFLENLIKLESNYFKINYISDDGQSIIIESNSGIIDKERFIPTVLPKKIPDLPFSLINKDNSSINIFLKKGKYVLIERWGTWCSGCIQQQPLIKEINDKYNSNVTIISLNGGDKNIEKVKSYITNNQMTWVNGFENQDIKENIFRSLGYPCAVLIDDSGEIVMRTSNFREILKYLNSIKSSIL